MQRIEASRPQQRNRAGHNSRGDSPSAPCSNYRSDRTHSRGAKNKTLASAAFMARTGDETRDSECRYTCPEACAACGPEAGSVAFGVCHSSLLQRPVPRRPLANFTPAADFRIVVIPLSSSVGGVHSVMVSLARLAFYQWPRMSPSSLHFKSAASITRSCSLHC